MEKVARGGGRIATGSGGKASAFSNPFGRWQWVFVLLVVAVDRSRAEEYFSNPILDGNSPDPAVLFHEGFYYLPLSTDSEHSITLHKSPVLTDFRNATKRIIYNTPPPDFRDLWASEMHVVDKELYIYFTMQGGGEGHRMYVMKAVNSSDPMGEWEEPIKLMPDYWEGAIDGTLLRQSDGRLYMIWSSIACLWIAPMENATAVGHSFVLLRRPSAEWECRGMNGVLCMSEGPFVIYNGNISYLIFSASETFSPHYCLGMMSIPQDRDPMVLSNWWYGPDGPVFWRNDEQDVYCTGHAAFTTSPDGTETWMVYHATDSPEVINGNRVARIEKIEWGEDGKPVFPRPHGRNELQPVPSGSGHQ